MFKKKGGGVSDVGVCLRTARPTEEEQYEWLDVCWKLPRPHCAEPVKHNWRYQLSLNARKGNIYMCICIHSVELYTDKAALYLFSTSWNSWFPLQRKDKMKFTLSILRALQLVGHSTNDFMKGRAKNKCTFKLKASCLKTHNVASFLFLVEADLFLHLVLFFFITKRCTFKCWVSGLFSSHCMREKTFDVNNKRMAHVEDYDRIRVVIIWD